MNTHAWSTDPGRDAAVRAEEDGRQGALPTLEEAIGEVFPRQEATVSGLRTERITLEVTHDLDARLSDWIVDVVDESLGMMESVRVVEDCCIDHINMGEVLRRRDAAIREREELRKGLDRTQRELSELKDTIVAELKAASGGEHSPDARKMVEQEPVAWGVRNQQDETQVWSVRATKEIAEYCFPASEGWQHFPLYRSPPPPRGWLSAEERDFLLSLAEAWERRATELEQPGTWGSGLPKPKDLRADAQTIRSLLSRVTETEPRGWLTPTQRLLLENAASTCRFEADSCCRNGDQHEASVYVIEAENIDEILARSTPPEVVKPSLPVAEKWDTITDLMAIWNGRWIAALAAAGVTVKEVG